MDSPLHTKRILIIGGSSGIGLATARLCLERGAEVIIAGRNRPRRERALVELKTIPEAQVSAQPVDFTRKRQVRRLFAKVGTIDHLVITAAQGTAGPFLSMRRKNFQEVFNKFWGQCQVIQQAVPHLAAEGSITLFSSITSRRAHEGLSLMGAVNAAIESLAKSLAFELAPRRVNVLCPGVIDTPTHDWLGEAKKADWFKHVKESIPLGRVGTPENVAEATVHLMENKYATGVVLPIAGGQLLL